MSGRVAQTKEMGRGKRGPNSPYSLLSFPQRSGKLLSDVGLHPLVSIQALRGDCEELSKLSPEFTVP